MATFLHFNIVRGGAIDPMHGINGGVTKALISLSPTLKLQNIKCTATCNNYM